MTKHGRGWHGERERHSAAARGIKSKVAPLNDPLWLLAENKMEHLRDWSWRKTDLWHFGEFSVKDHEYFARNLEDVIMHLKNSQRRPPGFAESIRYAEGVLASWKAGEALGKESWYTTGLGLEAARQEVHIMMQGLAPS